MKSPARRGDMRESEKKEHLAGLRSFGAVKIRPRAKPTHDMKERIAVALRGSRPNFLYWEPTQAYMLYLAENDSMRAMYSEWVDRLLRHFDVLDLELINTRADEEALNQTERKPR